MLRGCPEITFTTLRFCWADGVVPFAVEPGPIEVDLGQFLIRNFATGGVSFLVHRRPNLQTRLGRRVCDQLDDDFVSRQRTATPVDRDLAEQAMLDLVPLAGARWKMTHTDCHSQFVRQALQGGFPQAAATAVTAALAP